MFNLGRISSLLVIIFEGFLFFFLHIDGCLGEDTAIMNGSKLSISWPEAGIGTQAVASCPCSPEGHAPLSDQATRTCGGTFAAGGQWEQLKDQSVCRSLHDNALKLCETTLVRMQDFEVIKYPSSPESPKLHLGSLQHGSLRLRHSC